MKNTIYMFALALATIFNANAQTKEDLVISDLKLSPAGPDVTVSFVAKAGDKAVHKDYNLVATPVLVKDGNRAVMQPIVVQGKRARINEERYQMTFKKATYPDAVFMSNGKQVVYSAVIHYQPWMEGAEISLEKRVEGCCSGHAVEDQVLASNVALMPAAPQPKPQPEPKPQPAPTPKQTTGDMLAAKYDYVVSAKDMSELPVRDKAIIVYYEVAKSESIDMSYRNNAGVMKELQEVINTIDKSDDSRVVRIAIAGYASPEGNITQNTYLGENRALRVKEYVLANSKIPASIIMLHNGAEDWEGLRLMVAASDMEYRDKVLYIIDNTPVWDAKTKTGRLSELKKLAGGKPYAYMLKNFFPDLRNAAYIMIYYENK